MRFFLLIGLLLLHESHGNFFKKCEDYIKVEEARRARELLESDLLGGSDNPKEIEIHCPQDPIVTIKDLIDETGSSAYESSECIVLKMTGPNFNMRLSMNCDENND